MPDADMIRIDDLRDRPDRVDDVADRIWKAWWRDAGVSLDALTNLVRDALGPEIVPTTFVAHRQGRFAGTAGLVAHDMDARLQYTPWVAAVWVDEEHRGMTVGSQLVRKAAAFAFDAGLKRIYLYCEPSMASFYEGMGWTLIETDVNGVDIFALDA